MCDNNSLLKGLNESNIFEHFVKHGRKEGRTLYVKNSKEKFAHFDLNEYKKVCKEAYDANINNEIWGYSHFITRCPKAKYVKICENKIFTDKHHIVSCDGHDDKTHKNPVSALQCSNVQ